MPEAVYLAKTLGSLLGSGCLLFTSLPGDTNVMKKHQFVYRSLINAPAEEVFRWHAQPGAFARYNPPWDPVELVSDTGGIEPGGRKVIRLRMGPMSKDWIAEHTDYEAGRLFRDVQVSGPFAHWEHTHVIEPQDEKTCVLEDRIEYALPLGHLGHLLGGSMVRDKLERMFAFRHRTLQWDMKAHQLCRGQKSMKILISGATGLVGTELVPFLTAGGHECVALTRKQPPGDNAVNWDPAQEKIDADSLTGFDAVVHLAGESIVGSWNEEKKKRIRESRVQGTRLLCKTLAQQDQPPQVLVSASAIGFYGDRGDEILNEDSEAGSSFLSEVCKVWEEACAPAVEKGIRVVNLRIGIVLSPKGGALAKMLFPFYIGAGGKIGSGKQYMSWVTLDELAGIIHHALHTDSLNGPVNAVSPNAVTNSEFTKTLGKVLWRPTLFPVPGFAARLMFGEMADELLLASTRVEPKKLLESGYQFRHTHLEEGLRHVLGRTKEPAQQKAG